MECMPNKFSELEKSIVLNMLDERIKTQDDLKKQRKGAKSNNIKR